MAHEREDDEGVGGQRPNVAAGRPFDLGAFNQSTWWFTPSGEQVAIDDLDSGDRHDLAEWLQEHARYFYLAVLRLELLRLAIRTASGAEAVADSDDASGRISMLVGAWRGVLRRRLTSEARPDRSTLNEPSGQPDTPSEVGRVEGEPDGVPELVFLSAEEWLESTPLFLAITRI